MVGRLSTYAKNRILNLRFQSNYKIKHIAQTLLQEDNIKVSRESISTFLKKYIDTKSINDKPRSGRNKKLTQEEIQLIGEVTRLNRDITAPKIKQYLNLNVSTHTILRASKLFEWNKNNPNSNEAKKAAALERQLNGESKRRSSKSYRKKKQLEENITENKVKIEQQQQQQQQQQEEKLNDSHNLNLITEKEILTIKNISSSPMVFSTKVLMKLFKPEELHGHNVSGKTFSKNVKNKKALDEKRIKYIRWLVENNFETSNREQLWKMCRTAINKIILISEKKHAKLLATGSQQHTQQESSDTIKNEEEDDNVYNETGNIEPLKVIEVLNQPGTTIVKLNDDTDLMEVEEEAEQENEEDEEVDSDEYEECENIERDEENTNFDTSNKTKKKTVKISTNKIARRAAKKEHTDEEFEEDYDVNDDDDDDDDGDDYDQDEEDENYVRTRGRASRPRTRSKSNAAKQNNCDYESIKDDTSYDLKLLNEKEILLIKNLYCSPMIFSTKVLTKIYTEEELCGHNLTNKTSYHKKSLANKPSLDEKRLMYIRWLVEKYFDTKNFQALWKSCRKAMCRVLRNIDKKKQQQKEKAKYEVTNNEYCKNTSNQSTTSATTTTVVVLIDDPKILEEQEGIGLESQELVK